MIEGVFSSFKTAETGMKAAKRQMEVFANNIANINTTRTKEGGPFRRQEVVLKEAEGYGVVVDDIKQIDSFRDVYDPNHPDADAMGYVHYPDIDLTQEWVKMIMASRTYEANIAAFNMHKQNFIRSLDLLQ